MFDLHTSPFMIADLSAKCLRFQARNILPQNFSDYQPEELQKKINATLQRIIRREENTRAGEQ